jgi:hypothetical protein
MIFKRLVMKLINIVNGLEFEACKVVNNEVLWMNNCSSLELNVNSIAKLAYVTNMAYSFSKVTVDFDDSNMLLAEQYGGRGLGKNGGGVRCGNLGHYQLKGIGVNQTVGNHDDFDHSSGMYPLYEAVAEAINSVVFNSILPLGTAEYYGVIGIGKSPYIEKYGVYHDLAIGVREKCIRPAHFMRAGNFEPLESNREQLMDDVQRVRNINQVFYNGFETENGFVQFIGKFLSNNANQFAYARIHQIAHGAVSSSNLVIDGKWLDLTNASFLPNNDNYCASVDTTPFYSEPNEICNIVDEWVCGISKYNNVNFDTVPLINYFDEQFEAYLLYYISSVFGFDCKVMDLPSLVQSKAILLKEYNEVCKKKYMPVVGFPVSKGFKNNGAFLFVENIFNKLISGDLNSNSSSTVNSLRSLIACRAYSENISEQHSTLLSIVSSYKKQLFISIFYIGEIHSKSKLFIDKKLGGIQNYIDGYHRAINWIFDKDDYCELVLFSSDEIIISISKITVNYSLHYFSEIGKFESTYDLLIVVNELPECSFNLLGHNFKDEITYLLRTLLEFELFHINNVGR